MILLTLHPKAHRFELSGMDFTYVQSCVEVKRDELNQNIS